MTLPPDTAAAVYISLPPSASNPTQTFKFLGGIGEGKESAVFKVSGLGLVEGGGGEITLGISLESASSVGAQIAALQSSLPSPQSSPNPSDPSQAMVLASKANNKPDTLLLAQRIIKNAFNFLASFSGNVNGGIEVVPLKAFEEWWKKFEGRVRNDPGFLERSDGVEEGQKQGKITGMTRR